MTTMAESDADMQLDGDPCPLCGDPLPEMREGLVECENCGWEAWLPWDPWPSRRSAARAESPTTPRIASRSDPDQPREDPPMIAQIARRPTQPFWPGHSLFAYQPDGTVVRCGMCGGRLELRSTNPAIIEIQGRWVRCFDYQCADHGFCGGQSYYEPASDDEAAEGEGYKAAEAAVRAARMAA